MVNDPEVNGKRPALVSQAEYARHRGCTKAAVTKAVRAGRIVLVDGKVNVAAADRQWAARSRPRSDSSSPPRSPVALAPAPPRKETQPEPSGNPVGSEPARAPRATAEVVSRTGKNPPAPPPSHDEGGGALDYAQERAALAREQRIAQRLKNDIARGEYAPIGLLTDVLAKASGAVVDRFEQLDGLLRKACPDLPEEARAVVLSVAANARNEWMRATVKVVEDHIDSLYDDSADADEDAAVPA